MLEAFDNEAFDKVFFLGALVDECCITNETVNFKRIFTMYYDVADLTYRTYLDHRWSNKELNELSEIIRKFKVAVYKVFATIRNPKRELKNGMY